MLCIRQSRLITLSFSIIPLSWLPADSPMKIETETEKRCDCAQSERVRERESERTREEITVIHWDIFVPWQQDDDNRTTTGKRCSVTSSVLVSQSTATNGRVWQTKAHEKFIRKIPKSNNNNNNNNNTHQASTVNVIIIECRAANERYFQIPKT